MSQRGASAAEYGLLIAGIAAVIALAVLLFGGSVVELFNQTCVSIQGSGSCA
ncbi:MAG: Flp family type IVb pilin [Nocardioides sp.]|uniref:Flp family type IVb pilin n=1 Tax=Nocardioides sp. TaxID=35761 RepID=UPI000C92C4BF|nr:Flp family type IVb pilin [Nocardioides sp.]MAS56606.1 Flp family type IVb pilin [Pimelobacter sp.]MDE0775054.1 Flp family type IVb pilin [Nocardioides sp.]